MRRVHPGELDADRPLALSLYDVNGRVVMSAGSVPAQVPQWPRWLTGGLFMDELMLWQQAPVSVRQHVLHAIACLSPLLAQPTQSRIFQADILALVELLQTACQQDGDAFMATIMLCQGGDPAARQAVFTAGIALRVLRSMALDEALEVPALAAALTLHLDPAALPHSLVRLALRQEDSSDALRRLGVRQASWLGMVQTAGRILTADTPARHNDVPQDDAAAVIALASLFCARLDEDAPVSDSGSRSVLRDLLIEHGARFDVRIASYFIRGLGVYPVGTLVELASGEAGVVCDQSEQLDAPWVCSLFTPMGAPHSTPWLRDSRQPGNAIRSSINPLRFLSEIDMVAIWGEAGRDYPLPQGEVLHGMPYSV